MTLETNTKSMPLMASKPRVADDESAASSVDSNDAALVPCQIESSNNVHSDHFTLRNGIEFAGTHIIIDLWGASGLDDLSLVERTLREAVEVSQATLLHIHLHHFTPNHGVSGVAVLAESHISVHTWPERDFAAFDVFMCGDAQPEKTIEVLQAAFKPSKISVSEHLRGAQVLDEPTDNS